jgi:hypothetical protein
VPLVILVILLSILLLLVVVEEAEQVVLDLMQEALAVVLVDLELIYLDIH